MNKSVKFLAISLLMVPALVRAADDSAPQSWSAYAWSGLTSGARELGTGFVGGVAGGASAVVGGELADKATKSGLGKDAINAFVVLGSAKGAQCVTKFTEEQLSIDNTKKTGFQRVANFAGKGTGWFVAHVFVASVISEAKKRADQQN